MKQYKRSSGRDKFVVDVPGPNDYKVEGSFWKHDYTFERKGKGLVATINKEMYSWTDSYGIKIVDGEDDISILATCIVIDQVCHDNDDDKEKEMGQEHHHHHHHRQQQQRS